jgi:hypothetical protein
MAGLLAAPFINVSCHSSSSAASRRKNLKSRIVLELTTRPTDICLLHIGREPGLELAHQWAEARHDGDRLEQRP